MTQTGHTEIVQPTPRERQLIILIARGLQNKAIAYELQISTNTVRAHIGNIMRKYKLRNRTQIAVRLLPQLRDAPQCAPRPRGPGASSLGAGP